MLRLRFAGKTAILLIGLVSILAVSVQAQTTAFTYQGRLIDATLPQPTNAHYEMEFKLFDALSMQLGSTQTIADVSVVNGIFTVQLDFGESSFGNARVFIETAVRPVGSAAAFTLLAPRQQITSAPFAIRSRISNLSENSNNSDALGGFPASNFVQTTDQRLSDDRNPNPFSANYIQNQNAISQAANFNIAGNAMIGGSISGNGANISALNAGNITTGTLLPVRGGTGLTTPGATGNFLRSNGSIWTSAPLTSSDFPTNLGSYIQNSSVLQPTSNFNVSGSGTVGGLFSANIVNSTTNFRINGTTVVSIPNSTSVVVGQFSNHTLVSNNNAFFGYKAGLSANSFSQANTFIGSESGESNTSGGNNAFVGKDSGFFNTSGSFNSFFGSGAGVSNKSASDNSFFGYQAGASNTLGTRNSFFGSGAGQSSLNVNDNSFFGYLAGSSTTGGSNSFFGSSAGSNNFTGAGNSFFGDSSGAANNSGSNNAFFGSGAGSLNTTGIQNSFFGSGAGSNTSTGNGNSVFGFQAGSLVGSAAFNTIIGYQAGISNFGSNNTFLGANSNSSPTTVNHSTALGADSFFTTSNVIVLGTDLDTVQVPNNIKVFGNTNIGNLFASGNADIQGNLHLLNLSLGGSTQVCRNASANLAVCSSSLRYKTNIAPYFGGLSLLNKLKPITFDWKDGGMHDLGFGAEDVEKVDKLLVIYNDSGQVEGVKYDRISAVLVNSIKEQQAQIEAQAEQIKQQSAQIEALKQIVCAMNPAAAICGK